MLRTGDSVSSGVTSAALGLPSATSTLNKRNDVRLVKSEDMEGNVVEIMFNSRSRGVIPVNGLFAASSSSSPIPV